MVLIAVPHTGNIRTTLAQKLIKLNENEEVELFFNSAKPVDANRCEIVKHFLDETDHETLLMIDSDILPPDNILELLEYDFDIITPVIYSTRDGIPYPVGASLNEEEGLSMHEGGDEEVVELDGIGTACMFIRREVLEEIDEPYFKHKRNDDGTLNTSEDFDFCLRARDLGYTVKMHKGYSCGHIASMNLEKVASNMNLALNANASNIFVEEVGGNNTNENEEE